jgi:hypothetical protein
MTFSWEQSALYSPHSSGASVPRTNRKKENYNEDRHWIPKVIEGQWEKE